MRRVFFISLFVAGVFSLPLFGAAPPACQCPVSTPAELTEQATYVFNAEVWDVALEKIGGPRVITLDVVDTFKGDPPSRIEVKDAEEGKECVTEFHEAESYLVYARWRWGNTLTSRCWGTKRLDQVGPESQGLGPGASAKAKYYDKLRIYCMGRRDTGCCLSSLKSMAAGGYLPQPEAGCADDMIPDRLPCSGSYIWCVPTLDPRRPASR